MSLLTNTRRVIAGALLLASLASSGAFAQGTAAGATPPPPGV